MKNKVSDLNVNKNLMSNEAKDNDQNKESTRTERDDSIIDSSDLIIDKNNEKDEDSTNAPCRNDSFNDSFDLNNNENDHDNTMSAYFGRGLNNTFMTLDQTGISNFNASLLDSNLDETLNGGEKKVVIKRRYSNESVIVINSSFESTDEEGEIKNNRTIKSIVISPLKKKMKVQTYCTPIKRKMFNSLLTNSEYKKNRLCSKNLYNPNVSTIDEEEDKENVTTEANKITRNITYRNRKRVIVVDGSNVGFHHGLSKELSVRGIEICIRYLEKLGHPVKVILPQFRLQYGKSSNPKKLNELYVNGKLFFTPCKNFGNGRCAMSYDDRYILQIAVEFDGAVISNDNYRDLISENIAFRKIIENRVIGFTWCHDLFILPKDPYGANGPSLDEILNF